MTSPRAVLPVLLLAASLGLGLAGCGGADDDDESDGGDGGDAAAATSPAPDPGPTTGRVLTIRGNQALTWGDGAYGVVLAHGTSYDAASWEEQAVLIAGQGATVIAVEDISPGAIGDAVERLRKDGVPDVALVGGSAGADAILEVAAARPNLPDQLVLLSPNQQRDGLGGEPKLFVASADEPLVNVARALAATSPGDENEELVLPGSAHAQSIFDGDQGDEATDALLARLRAFSSD